jgi:hypothetical protein
MCSVAAANAEVRKALAQVGNKRRITLYQQ